MPIPLLARRVFALGAFLAVTACVGASGGSIPVRSEAIAGRGAARLGPAAVSTVYVASRNDARILGFPIDGNGNIAPSVTIKGAKTLLTQPVSLAVSSKGEIYTANDSASEILIFAPGAHGNTKPQVLGGPKVPLERTGGIALDASNNIFVSDYEANRILVFKAGSTGDTAPIRTISGKRTKLADPIGMAIDSAGNLFVANFEYPSTHSILEFAPNAKGNVRPISHIGGSNTMIVEPSSVSLDSTGRIIVPSNSAEILIFAKGAKGNIAPAEVISGSNAELGGVSSAGVDPSNEIFVTECCPTDGTILVFASGASGNVAPIRSISGSKTHLSDSFYPSFH
jgi:hypothetical protein